MLVVRARKSEESEMKLECLTPEFPQGARVYSVDGVAPSLLNSASAMRSQAILVSGGGGSMKICESGPVICRASGQASADTLNETCPCLTCDHEAPIVAGAYCMAGNFVDRNTNQNGCGVRENASFTLNTVDRHAVAYDARHHCLGGEVSGTLQAKGEGGWSLNYINPVLQPLPENTVGIDLYNGAVTGNTAATLTKKNDGTSSGPEVAQRKTPDWIVRRLIPMECGRLQGFPDGWAEIEPLTDLRELPFWREVYTKDCEIKGKKPNRKMMQADSEEGRRALMRWHDGLHSRAAEYAMWGNGMALPNALFFVKNAFRELGKPPGEIKLGSLFDGSGTMPLCAAMCGGHPVWASEVEPYPIAVTKTHLPNMKHLGSVTDIKGFLIEPVDIITFGSPCQDLSIAGKRAGLNGAKSGLFWEAIRIIWEMLLATGGKYPRFVIWENVPGALSSNKGKDFEVVLNELLHLREFAGGRADQSILQHGKWGGASQTTELLPIELSMLNGGESPSAGAEYMLSAILVENPPEWSFLSEKALNGILNRASRRGKKLQDLLLTAIHGMIEWWQQNPAGGGQREAYTMKIRSGCDGGGKGPLVQEELSATLATHQDQTLFELRNTVLNDQDGGFMEVTHGMTGTLRAQEHGHAPITFDKTEGNEKT